MVQLPQNKKTRISIEHLASNVTINSYLGHDLYLAFFKIKYWIGRWLPWNWNERWTYLLDARPQMWLSVSLWSWPWCFLSHGGLWKQKIISLIGCEAHRLDITDSYWVDLRCWYAIDSSSLKAYTYLQFWWVSGPWTTAGPHDRAIYRVNALEIQQSCAEQSLCWLIGEFCGVMMCPLCFRDSPARIHVGGWRQQWECRHGWVLTNHIETRRIDTLLCCMLNSLWPRDVVWRQGSRSTLAQVMACCLTAPSHYLNQCWLMISEVLWHSPNNNFTENT